MLQATGVAITPSKRPVPKDPLPRSVDPDIAERKKREECWKNFLHSETETATITLDQFFVYRADFKKFDVSGTGYIDGKEVEKLVAEQLGAEPTKDAMAHFLLEFDGDADAKIRF